MVHLLALTLSFGIQVADQLRKDRRLKAGISKPIIVSETGRVPMRRMGHIHSTCFFARQGFFAAHSTVRPASNSEADNLSHFALSAYTLGSIVS